jgi:hypothetical protein
MVGDHMRTRAAESFFFSYKTYLAISFVFLSSESSFLLFVVLLVASYDEKNLIGVAGRGVVAFWRALMLFCHD